MIDVHTVFVQIQSPKPGFSGRVVEGNYIIKDGEVVLVDRRGNAAQDDTGKKYTHKLAAGDNPKQIAARLTRELRKALRGPNAPPSGFGGPINYPKMKNA